MIAKFAKSLESTSLLALAAILAAGMGGLAVQAQETIATAQDAPLDGAPTPQGPAPLDPQGRRLGGGEDIVRNVNSCGAPPKDDGTKDKSPHGEVYAGIGNHGYREAGGVVCVPLGDHVSATIAIDAGRYPGWRGRPY
jgi:hypothetical protein